MIGLTYEVAEPTYVSFHSRSFPESAYMNLHRRWYSHTLLQRFQALKCNLELVRRVEGRRVIEHLDVEKRDDLGK